MQDIFTIVNNLSRFKRFIAAPDLKLHLVALPVLQRLSYPDTTSLHSGPSSSGAPERCDIKDCVITLVTNTTAIFVGMPELKTMAQFMEHA